MTAQQVKPPQPQQSKAVVAPVVQLKRLLADPAIVRQFEGMLAKRAPHFISSILSVAQNSKHLMDCEPITIIQAAAQAATFDLPINQNLGFAHIVPYKGIATFQIGWKGIVQLALRTGLYKTINCDVVHKGQIKERNFLTGEIAFNDEGTSEEIEGYFLYFKLLNGFEKFVYMSREKMEKHARKYSQSYKKGYGMWVDDFDAMGLKTIVKLGLSKWGPLSIEMQQAFEADQAQVIDGEVVRYPDANVVDAESSAEHLAEVQAAHDYLPGVEPKQTAKEFCEKLKTHPEIVSSQIQKYLSQGDSEAAAKLQKAAVEVGVEPLVPAISTDELLPFEREGQAIDVRESGST